MHRITEDEDYKELFFSSFTVISFFSNSDLTSLFATGLPTMDSRTQSTAQSKEQMTWQCIGIMWINVTAGLNLITAYMDFYMDNSITCFD